MTLKYIRHPTFQNSQDIHDICKPLEKLDISYFGHAIIDNEGKLSALSSHAPFFESYLQQELYHFDLHTCDLGQVGKFIIWDEIEVKGDHNKLDQTASEFGIVHTCTLVEKDHKGLNLFHFSSDHHSFSNQLYVTNQDLLKLFAKQFKRMISESKHLASAYDFKFSPCPKSDYVGFAFHEIDEMRRGFLKEMEKNGVSDLLSASLTKRELEFLKLYVTGKTAREIATIFSLSHRTVQNYLQSIKDKCGTKNKVDLILKTIELLPTDI